MLLWALLAMIAIIPLFPETRIGRLLRRILIEEPAERLNRLSARRACLSVASFIVLIAIMPVLMQAAIPAELALLMAGDMVTYLEAAAMVWLVAARGRLRAAIPTAIRVAVRFVRRPAPRQGRRMRRAGRKDAESDGADLAFA